MTLAAVRTEVDAWHRVAAMMGVDATYRDGTGKARTAPLPSVRLAMSAMGAPTSTPAAAETWLFKEATRPSPVEIKWDAPSFGCDQTSRGYRFRAPAVYAPQARPRIGAFLPLYALHSSQSLGIGDLSDLRRFAHGCAERGYGFVATLPLFAAFLRRRGPEAAHFDASPYAPISRSHFNELYLDPRETDEWPRWQGRSDALEGIAASLEEEVSAPYVDYARLAEQRRMLIEPLAKIAEEGGALDDAEEGLRDYASFRAHGDADEARYHLYAQMQLRAQLRRASRETLYLDLPVGVHRAGFDAHRYEGDFLRGFAAGAPPDAMFPGGQCWGITALDPRGARRSGYASLRSAVRTLSRYARLLRLDHVMALHRTFCIPDGASPHEGVYVRANAEELYAALLATAASAEVPPILIGEDLGTVPTEVRATMATRGLLGMHVSQIGMEKAIAQGQCASINTHDLAPFAAFVEGADLRDYVELGIIAKSDLPGALNARKRALGGRSYEEQRSRIVSSAASHVVINVEDEWGEKRPQNTPGTSTERPNFKRRAALSLEAMLTHLPNANDGK